MSPQNPEKDGNKGKDEEKKGGAVPLWSEAGSKQNPASFWTHVNPPKTPLPKPVPDAGLPSFRGAKSKQLESFFPSVGKPKSAGIPLLKGMQGGTIVNRLKGLKSKDIVFIAAGLSVLVLAPIAEHMISSPEGEGGTLQQGFSVPGSGTGLFGGETPFEGGVANIAPGNLPGQGTEVVTPLNVRDPASLIMSPGGEKKEAAAPVEPPKAPPPTNDGWKDALSKAASKGVTKAAGQAHLPVPGGKLNKIPGLGSPSGGSHAGLNLAAPSSSGLFSKPNVPGHMASVTSAPGYNGAARRSNTGTGANLSGIGGKGGPGGAAGGASEMGPGGVSGGGTGASGGSPWSADASKNPGNNGSEGNKNIGINQKEDLAWLRRKMEMEKAVDLKWAKKKYDQLERKKMLEQIAAQTAQQAFLKILDKLLSLLDGAKGGGKDGGGKGGDSGGKPDGGKPDGGKPDPGAPGQTPRPGSTGAPTTASYRMDMQALEQAHGQVRASTQKMKSEPPTPGGRPNVEAVSQIQPKASFIDAADQSMTQAADQLGKIAVPEPGQANPGLQGYPTYSADNAALKAQHEEFLSVAKAADQNAKDAAKANEGIRQLSAQLPQLGSQASEAAREAEKQIKAAQEQTRKTEKAVSEVDPKLEDLKKKYESASDEQKKEIARQAAELVKKAQDSEQELNTAKGKAQAAVQQYQAKARQLEAQVRKLEEQWSAYRDSLVDLTMNGATLGSKAKALDANDSFFGPVAKLVQAESDTALKRLKAHEPQYTFATRGFQYARRASRYHTFLSSQEGG